MFRRMKLSVVAAAMVMSSVLPAFAWDEVGHKITSYIAWSRMTPDVREKVIKILLAAPEDAQLSTFYAGYGSRTEQARKREFFMLASTWPDIIRDRNFPVRQKNYAHSDWHYQDTFWKFENGKVEVVPSPDATGKAVDKMTEFAQLIRGNAPDAQKAIAIAWLQHLIGDIHQPLHTSARVTSSNPKGDQGGNLFLLTPKGTPRDKQENLHWFWDSIVVRWSANSKDLCDAEYVDPTAEAIMKLYPYEKLRTELGAGEFSQWQQEGFKIASTEVYRGVSWFQMPSDSYKKKAHGIAQRRLALAGYRMADLFNSAFMTGPPPAVTGPGRD